MQQAVLVLDLGLVLRSRLELADVMAVKVGADEQSFTLHTRKSAETFVCLQRADLLSVLLPLIQGDVGGLIFSLLKWSKRMMTGDAAASTRAPVRFRLWSGRLAVVREDADHCSCDIPMHAIARILVITDDRTGLVLQLKVPRGAASASTGGGRIVRFSVGDTDNRGHANYSARDRLVRALADGLCVCVCVCVCVSE